MIDLHLHTYFSDGLLSPRALVLRAKELGAGTIAVTDHDGVRGIAEAQETGLENGIKVIPGIEFSAALAAEHQSENARSTDKSVYMHLLGYGINPADEALGRGIERIRGERKERNEKMHDALCKLGYPLDWDDLKVYEEQEYVGKPNFARALVKKGYASSVKEAFEDGKFLRLPEIRAIHRVKIDAAEAIDLIRGAGGIAVLAHPMKLTFREKKEGDSLFEKLFSLVIDLKRLGLSGMECYYNNHSEEETKRLLKIAEQQELLVSAGTDFHGPGMNPDIEIGRFPVRPDERRLAGFLARCTP